MQQSSWDYILEQLDHGRITGSQCMAKCPAHEDSDPSLSVGYKNGRVLLKCMAGCDTQDVLAQLGLGWDVLFDEGLNREELVHSYRYQRPDGQVHMTVERWRQASGKKSFKQRGSDGEYKLRDTRPCLYNLPVVIPHCRDGGEIWITEGEKDVHALRVHHIVATTAPLGCEAEWLGYYGNWLKGASGVVVVADDDEPGRRRAAAVTAVLRGQDFQVRTVLPAEGCKDAFDHFAAGHNVDQFRGVNLNRLRPPGIGTVALGRKLFPPINWCVEGLLPSGLALLGGPPKIGKSLMALDLALGVASGGKCLSHYQCCGGDVLYLSLDNDSERRLQLRIKRVLGNDDTDYPIEFHTEWPTSGDAIAACQEWINEVPRPRLIVMDTLVRAEPEFENSDRNLYAHSTEVLSRWARMAENAGITVLAVHHDRKPGNGDEDDWINRFTGSRGVTATAATLLFLDAKRGSRDGALHVTGRDVETYDLSITWAAGLWLGLDNLPRLFAPPAELPDDPGITPQQLL